MPIIQATPNLKLEKPEANHAAWERSYWRLATLMDLWLTQIARGHYVVLGGNLTLDGTDVDLDATTVQFVGTAAAYAVGPSTPISPLVSGNTYIVYVDNAGALQVAALTPSLLWSGALPSDFVLLGAVYEVEGVWTIHGLPLVTGRGKLGGVASLDGLGQLPSSQMDNAFVSEFGDGSDGDVALSAGTTTLTRDMYYNTLTLSGTAKIVTAGFRIFVKDPVVGLDLTNAPANSISYNGNNGGNAASGVGGSAAAGLATNTVGGSPAGVIGNASGTAAPNPGNNATPGNGGDGGLGGADWQDDPGAAGGSATASVSFRRWAIELVRGALVVLGGASGGPGNGGGPPGASGGTGSGGGVVYIAAHTITRAASTAAGAISANAGTPGSCFAATSSGGAGGSGGSGGGWIYIVYRKLLGALAANALRANGSAGAQGGNTSSGVGGDGGAGGNGGRITLVRLEIFTVNETLGAAGAAGSANVGTVGGTGGDGGVCQANL